MNNKISYLEDISCQLDCAIFKTDNQFDRLILNRTNAIIREYSREWANNNKKLSSLILKHFNSDRKTKSSDKKWVITTVNALFIDFAKPLLKSTTKNVQAIYEASKKQFVSIHEIQPIKKVDLEIVPVFTAVDETIVLGITQQHQIASNAFYEENLSKEVSQIVNDTFKEGLNFKNTGIQLEKRLTEKLGLKKGIADLKIVPEGYKGSIESYFRGLGETTLNRGRNFSSLRAIADAEISRYTITAILDIKTSTICRHMHGRSFSTEQGLQYIDNVINSKTVEEFKSVAGWKRDLSEFGITGQRQKLNDTDLSSQLANAGLALPEYHFKCRTTVEPE